MSKSYKKFATNQAQGEEYVSLSRLKAIKNKGHNSPLKESEKDIDDIQAGLEEYRQRQEENENE